MSFGGRWTGWSKPAREKQTNEERFWSQVQKMPSGCWEWQGALDKDGYGVVNISQPDGTWKVAKTHRYSLEIKLGGPFDGQANHECDNRKCCNPNHLYAGTQLENMADARQRGRIGTPARSRVRALLMREAGFTQREVAEEFGVSQPTVSKWEKRNVEQGYP
jgi:hypothetical protein